MAAARKAAAAKTTTTRKAAAKTTTRKPATKRAPAKRTARKPAAETRPPGRPPLLEVEPELQGKIVTFVRNGAFPERAATAVGISERTHYAWMARGRDEIERRELGEKPDPDEQLYVAYANDIDRAVAEAEMLLMGSALKGGSTATAAMTILERRFRERWGVKAPPPATTGPAPTAGPTTGLDMLEQRRQERAREQARP